MKKSLQPNIAIKLLQFELNVQSTPNNIALNEHRQQLSI